MSNNNRFSSSKKVKISLKSVGCCFYCGCSLAGFAAGEVHNASSYDHLIPKIMFGGNTIDNLVLSCKSCNYLKSGRTYEQFKEFIGFVPFGESIGVLPYSIPNLPSVEEFFIT